MISQKHPLFPRLPRSKLRGKRSLPNSNALLPFLKVKESDGQPMPTSRLAGFLLFSSSGNKSLKFRAKFADN
jgi:hypothetical protein